MKIRIAALAAVLASCAACSDPIQGYCEEFKASDLPLEFSVSIEAPAAGCPAFDNFTVPTNESAACGDGCTCSAGSFVESSIYDSEGEFGPTTTHFCNGTFTRTCAGQAQMVCGAANISADLQTEGLYDVNTECTMPNPQGGPACVYYLLAQLN